MRINDITIENFKCFAHQHFSFDPGITVVIGNNTAGKTTLLSAVAISLGAYFRCLKHLKGSQAVRCDFKEGDRMMTYNAKNKDYLPSEAPTQIAVQAAFTVSSHGNYMPQPVSWYRKMTDKGSTTHNRECCGELMDIVEDMEAKRWSKDIDDTAIYPLVLSFGTNRIDAQFKTYKKTKERQQRLGKGYRAALKSDSVDFASAMEWLNRYDKDLKDGKEFDGTREAFFEAMGKAIPALSELTFDNREIEAVVKVSNRNAERHHYSYMSDGFKALINIVSEIAYRCIMLNGYLGREAVRLTPGVVLIDEVDLYLHPHWQRHVLQDLKEAFPNIQFIVTTHSPFIIQSVGEGQLISLDNDVDVDEAPDTLSLEEIAASYMDMNNLLRSKQYQKMYNAASEYYRLSQKDKATPEDLKRYQSLEAEFSHNPVYAAVVNAMIEKK